LISGVSHAGTIRILNWEDYLGKDVQSLWFEQGHDIETVLFDNDQKRDAILINNKKSMIDVAVVDETIGQLFGEQGRLLELNTENVPSLSHMDPFWRKRCGKFAVPYLWGTMGIAYRTDKVVNTPQSWLDLLEPADYLKGHIGMMDDHTDMLAPVFFVKGISINTEQEVHLKQAFNMLKRQAPNILTYDYPISFISDRGDSDQLYMAQVYSGDQLTMNEKVGSEGLWEYAVPKEGSLLWIDCLSIPTNSSNQALALQFIDFLNKPKIAALNAEELYLATPNTAAKAYLSDDFKNDKAVFPDESIIHRSDLYQRLKPENIKLRLRITNAIVNIYESSKTR
jgi:spermidine/putrescine transport system substrate-binding protein